MEATAKETLYQALVECGLEEDTEPMEEENEVESDPSLSEDDP